MKKHFAMLRRPLSFILAVLMVLSCVNGAVFTAAAAENSVAAKELLLELVKGDAEKAIIADYVTLETTYPYDGNDAVFEKQVNVAEVGSEYVITAKTAIDNMGAKWVPTGVEITCDGGEILKYALTEDNGVYKVSVDAAKVGKSYAVAFKYALRIALSKAQKAELEAAQGLPAGLKADQDALASLSSAQTDLNALLNTVEIEGVGEVQPLEAIWQMCNEGYKVTADFEYEGREDTLTLVFDISGDKNAADATATLWEQYISEDGLAVLKFIKDGTVNGKYNPIYSLALYEEGLDDVTEAYDLLMAIEGGLAKLDAKTIVEEAVADYLANEKPELVEEANAEALQKLNEALADAPEDWDLPEKFETKAEFEAWLKTADATLKANVDETALKELNEEIAKAPESMELTPFESKAEFDEFVSTSGAYFADKVNEIVAEEMAKALEGAPEDIELPSFATQAELEAYLEKAEADLKQQIDDAILTEVNDAVVEANGKITIEGVEIDTFEDKAAFDAYLITGEEELTEQVNEKALADLNAAVKDAGYAEEFASREAVDEAMANPLAPAALVEAMKAPLANWDSTLNEIHNAFVDMAEVDSEWEDAYAEVPGVVEKLTDANQAWKDALADADKAHKDLNDAQIEWNDAYAEVEEKVAEMNEKLADWNKALSDIANAEVPDIAEDHEAVTKVQTMLDELNKMVAAAYLNLETAATYGDWYLPEQDLIAEDADYAALNALVAAVGAEQDALADELETDVEYVYNYAVATSTVTVNAVIENVFDAEGKPVSVATGTYYKYYSQDDAPATASVAAEIQKELEYKFTDLVKGTAYGTFDAEHYNIEWKWAVEPGVKLEESNTYTLHISAKEYAITEKWSDEPTMKFYGEFYEGMVIHPEVNKYEYIYTDGTNTYYQGEQFQVNGDVTVDRTQFAKATNMTVPQIVVAAGLVDSEVAQKILGSAALISDSYRIRFPNTAATRANSLVKVNGEKVITETFTSGFGDLLWAAQSGVLTFEDGTTKTIGLASAENTIEEVYKQIEAVYALDLTGKISGISHFANLPAELIAEYNAHEAELIVQTSQTRIDNLNMIGNALPFIKNNLPDGSEANNAYAAIEAHLYDGKIPMVTHLNEIANLRNAGKDATAMAYYYQNAASLLNSMEIVKTNVPIMIADENIQKMLKDNGYSLDDIVAYLKSLEQSMANLGEINESVNVTSASLQSLMEIIAENKNAKLDNVNADNLVLTAKLAPVAGPGHKEIFITVGGATGGITVQDSAATLGEDNAKLINDTIEALKEKDKPGEVYFYDYEDFDITADTKIQDLVEMNDFEGLVLNRSAKEFQVEVPGADAPVTVTIEKAEIPLQQHEVPGYFYTYYVWNANGKVVAEYEVRNGVVVSRSLPVLSAVLEVEDFKALVQGGKITREETDIVTIELENFASKVDGATLIDLGDEFAYVLPVGASKEGTSVVMDFITSLIMENVGYNKIMLDADNSGTYDEDEVFYDGVNGKIHLQALVDAFLFSGAESNELAERITNRSDLASELGYGKTLGIKVIEVPMQMLGASYPAEAMLYITLDEVTAQIESAIVNYNKVSDYAKARMANGEVRLIVTMPENYPFYEAYMALMMMEDATYTDSITGETVTASWDTINKMNGAMAFQYLFEEVIGSVVTDENVTIDTYDNTIDILNTIVGKVINKQLPNIPETVYAMGKAFSVEEMYEKFASYYEKKNLVYDGANDQVYKEGMLPIQGLVGKLGLSGMESSIAEYNTGLKVRVAAEITDAKPNYEALVVELRAAGITNKVHMTEDVVGTAANMAGAGAIMLLADVDELVLNSKTVLDLNGNHVNSIVANGFVAILDSSLGNGSVGSVTGNARVMGGNYAQADIDQYLANGYGVEDGAVYNKLYSITNIGDELNIKVHVNKNNMAQFVNIEGAAKLVMQIVSDIAFNYQRSASLYFNIEGEECMLYDFYLENVLGTAASANRSNVLSLVIDTIIGDEAKGIPGWINESQYAKIVNDIVAQLTDFQNMDITGATPFYATEVAFAEWDIDYGHVEHPDYEDGYLDFSIGSAPEKTNKKVNFFLDVDSSIADSLLSFLADIVYVNDLELTLDQIDYNDAGDFVTNGSYGGNVTIDINVRDEADDVRYMNTIMAILANNSDEQDKWVAAINSEDYLCLYNLFNKVTLEDLLEAIAAAGSIDADVLDGLYADLKAVGKADKQILIDLYNIALDSVTLDKEAINELYIQAKSAAPENVAIVKELLKAVTQGSAAVKALADDLKAVYATDKEVAKKLVEVIRVCVDIDRAEVKSFGKEAKAIAADNLSALKACFVAFRDNRTSNLAAMAANMGITEPVENRFNIFVEALSYPTKLGLKIADYYDLDPAFLQRTMGSFEGAKGVYDIRSTRTVAADVSIRGFSLTSSFSTDDLALVLDLFPTDLGEHIPAAPVVENNIGATCTTKGSYDLVVYCQVCEVELSRTHYENELLPHVPADAVKENEVAATCTTKGSYDLVVYCSVCGHEISRTNVVVDEIAHTPADAVKENEVAATCTAKGSYDEVVYCSVCGHEISRTTVEVDMIAHTPAAAVKENEVAADCVNNGSYDEVVYCSVCGTELSREAKTVPATGHTPAAAVKENEVAATCTAKGSYDEVVYCSVCGHEIIRTTVEVDMIAHTPAAAVKENEVAATCTAKGSYDLVVYCSVCGTELSRETKSVDELGHDWGEWKSISDTQHERVCKRDASHIERGDHIWGNDDICDLCGHKKPDGAHQHVAGETVIENVVEATCTTDGKHDEVVYCSVCGEEMSRNTIVDKAFGHKEGDWTVLQASNCFIQGLKGIKCVTCGEVLKTEKLPFGFERHICSHIAQNCDSLNAGLMDVDMKEWYHDHVDCIVYRGIMIGMSETAFEPSTTTSRAMVVQMLYRMECKRQGVKEGELKYNYSGELADLVGDEWYAEAAMWANATGVLKGVLYADGTIKFDGNDPVTREQLVAFLYRYVGEFRGVNTNYLADITDFADHVDVADWAYTGMRWAVGNGLIIGEGRSVRNNTNGNLLIPMDDATRAEIATVFHRMLELVIEPAEAGK